MTLHALFDLWVATVPFQVFAGAWWLRGRYDIRRQRKPRSLGRFLIRQARIWDNRHLNAHALPVLIGTAVTHGGGAATTLGWFVCLLCIALAILAHRHPTDR